MSIFGNLDILITLRCNAQCKNCIEMCNSYERTGLDYKNMDMILEQIMLFCKETRVVWEKQKPIPLWGNVVIAGGEPLLHPDVVEISKMLKAELRGGVPLAERLILNTNMTLPIPSDLACPVENYSLVEQKPKVHNTVLLHPDDMGCRRPTYAGCQHYRKSTRVLSKYGFTTCCAGDGYIRLFCLESLVHDHVPASLDEWRLDDMDAACQHCPFGCEKQFFEKDIGTPVSKIYGGQAELNKKGRKISRIYGCIQ